MDMMRKYRFSWDLIGDVNVGRPNLGPNTRLEVYRLMQFAFRDVLEQIHGPEETDRIFWKAGHLAGMEFFRHVVEKADDFNDFVTKLQKALIDLNIGVLRVEKADLQKMSFVLVVSEDLDCSGLPEIDQVVCIYDEGFIAGLLECHTGKKWNVKEVDCWCTGDRTCRFTADIQE